MSAKMRLKISSSISRGSWVRGSATSWGWEREQRSVFAGMDVVSVEARVLFPCACQVVSRLLTAVRYEND